MRRVSIIVPIYNASEYLRECLESIIKQTLQEIEIICVDAGSTDGSVDIINEYTNRDARIMAVTNAKCCFGKTVNIGIESATGEYISVVSPNVYIEPETYEEVYNLAQKNCLDFVSLDYSWRKKEKQVNACLQYKCNNHINAKYGEVYSPTVQPECMRFYGDTWVGIYRKSFIDAYHIRYNEMNGGLFQNKSFVFQTHAYAQKAMLINKSYYKKSRVAFENIKINKENVYDVNREYDFIRDLLMRDREIWQRFQYIYWWKKYQDYRLVYNCIEEDYREEFIERMRSEYKRAMQLGQLSENLFKKEEWEDIINLMNGTRSIVDKSITSRLKGHQIIKKIVPYVPAKAKRLPVKVLNKCARLIKSGRKIFVI